MESGSAGPWMGGLTVRTEQGLLRGRQDKAGTLSWKGIPYASAPLGELRWMPPAPPPSWEGMREADRFGGRCVQFKSLGGGITGTEDCLYLNAWRPDTREKGLPVYVFIHGGGNTMGSADGVPDYFGQAFASSQNLLFISINYRLGPLGWFLAPGLGEAEGTSPNLGSLDIIAALEWVRDNAAAFGGDPSRVTVAGESAGGANIMSLLTCPRAAGLFHRAVIESGYPKMETLQAAGKASTAMLAHLLEKEGRAPAGGGPAMAASLPRAEAMAFLRSLPARRLLSALEAHSTGMSSWPSIYADGILLPADGYASLDRGELAVKVPVITGTNREENKIFLFFEGKPRPGTELFRATVKYGSMNWRALSVDGFAERLARVPGQPPVWCYRFDWGSPDAEGRSELPRPWGERLGAFHALEVPFFLGTESIFGSFMTRLLFTRGNRSGRQALSGLCVAYLGAFTRSGDPNPPDPCVRCPTPDLPRWDPWSSQAGAPTLMMLDARKGRLACGMTAERVSVASVNAEMEASLDPETLEKVRAAMFKLD